MWQVSVLSPVLYFSECGMMEISVTSNWCFVKFIGTYRQSVQMLYLFLPSSEVLTLVGYVFWIFHFHFHMFVPVFHVLLCVLLFITNHYPIFPLFSLHVSDLLLFSCHFLRLEMKLGAVFSHWLAHLQLNHLSRKSASPGKRWLESLWDYLSACVKMLSFRRHGDADCNGVIVLMLLLTSEPEPLDLLRFNTSLPFFK